MDRWLARLLAASIEGLKAVVEFCTSMPGLHCLDPPLFTTRFLRSRGFGEYEVRRLWSVARRLSGGRCTVYSFEDTRLDVRPRVTCGAAYHHAGTMVPVDRVDCEVLGGECLVSTRTNSFYVYVEGHIERNTVRINLAHLAVLAARSSRGLVEELLDHAARALTLAADEKRGELLAVLGGLADLLARYRDVVEAVLPTAPSSLGELLRLSPVLRRLYEGLS